MPDIARSVDVKYADELWERIRAGDADAFGVLFTHHAREMYNYCFRRTADWAVAEDLTSIVFLEAWRRRDKELMPDKVLPWLYGIANNVVRTRRRSARRYAAALERVGTSPPTPDFSDDLLERLGDQEQMAAALRVVAKLPLRQQDVLALCVWSGLDYEAAAAVLDVPVGTVRSRLSRARSRLRELLAVSGHEPGAEPIDQEP